MPFLTDKAAKEKIAGLDQRIEELEADNTAALEQIETLESEATSKDQTIAEHVATIGAAEEAAIEATHKITGLETELTEAQAEVVETRESVGKQVSEALAGLGIKKPIETDANNGDDNKSNEVSREDFNAMSPRDKSEFSKNGGKIKAS